MKIGIYYFTRTGNCKRIGEKIGEKLNLEVYPIKDDVDWTGFKAYFKFQSYAKGKKKMEITYYDTDKFDRFILVSPVWGSRMPPTVKLFLENIPMEKVDMVVSSKMDKMRGIEDANRIVHIKQYSSGEDEKIEEYIKTFE